MNPSDLRSRLDAIKKKGKIPLKDNENSFPDDISDPGNPAAAGAASQNNADKASHPDMPEAEKALLENGWKRISDMVYEKITLSGNPLPEKISDFLMPQKADSSSLVFYDTETTGLSGGAVNLVFLAGFGFP